MQDGKYMNVRIVEIIFLKKDERELISEAHEKFVFDRSDILKTFSQLFTEQKPGFLF